MSLLNFDYGEIVLTWLLEDEEDCVTASPKRWNRSRPINDFRPSVTTRNVAELLVQPLLDTGFCTLPSMWIGSFKKFRSCRFGLSQTQNACEMLSTTCDASDQFRMLHALPKSTSSFVEILPIFIGMF